MFFFLSLKEMGIAIMSFGSCYKLDQEYSRIYTFVNFVFNCINEIKQTSSLLSDICLPGM